ncbi:unnamed protein product [Ixodes persulcatus]
MSHHSDEALLVAGSDSFWEPGNYKRTSKRTEDGHRLCADLVQLVQERSEVEKAYAKGLRAWARKWADLIDKGPEYGTTEAAWKGALLEAERTSEMHLRVRDRLLNDVVPQVKGWQKENYHRSMMQLRERRELDEAFKKAQKPWAKLLAKVDRSRTDYHAACKGERSATNQERNAGADTSLSPDQVSVSLTRRSRGVVDFIYGPSPVQCLQGSNVQNPLPYVFLENCSFLCRATSLCVPFKLTKLIVLRDKMPHVDACRTTFTTHTSVEAIVERHRNHQYNCGRWGPLHFYSPAPLKSVPVTPPFRAALQEYTPEVQQIHRKEKKALDAGGITLTSVSTRADGAPVATAPKAGSGPKRDKDVKDGGTASNHAALNARNNPSANNNNTNGRGGEANPFDEDHEDWDEESNDALVDTGEPGVPVRALYDYEGAEADELSFKQGGWPTMVLG